MEDSPSPLQEHQRFLLRTRSFQKALSTAGGSLTRQQQQEQGQAEMEVPAVPAVVVARLQPTPPAATLLTPPASHCFITIMPNESCGTDGRPTYSRITTLPEKPYSQSCSLSGQSCLLSCRSPLFCLPQRWKQPRDGSNSAPPFSFPLPL